jgi:hypothetical protein
MNGHLDPLRPSPLVFPFEETPARGRTMVVAPGVHWIRMPLPGVAWYRLIE